MMATDESDQSERDQTDEGRLTSSAEEAPAARSSETKAGLLAAWKELGAPLQVSIIVALIGAMAPIVSSIFTTGGTWLMLPTAVPPTPTATVTVTPTATPTPRPPIVISVPQNGSEVDVETSVSGRLGDKLCAGCQVYVVVHPLTTGDDSTWYGQAEAATLEDDSHFTLDSVHIGRDFADDECKRFEVRAVISPFNLRGKRWNRKEWEEVNAHQSAVVTVTRSGSCP